LTGLELGLYAQCAVPSLTEVAVAVPLNFSPFGEVVTHVIEAPRLATKRGGASERRESKEQPASAVGQAMCLPGADAALTEDNTAPTPTSLR
jgi:hypothetical protein